MLSFVQMVFAFLQAPGISDKFSPDGLAEGQEAPGHWLATEVPCCRTHTPGPSLVRSPGDLSLQTQGDPGYSFSPHPSIPSSLRAIIIQHLLHCSKSWERRA